MAGAESIPTPLLSPGARISWRVVQVVIWAAGMFIWAALLLKPDLGLHLLWNVLIPIAPALLVLAPGIWRNVCPLASMSVMPHHLKLSKRRKLPAVWRGRFFLGAFILLMVVVPFRKVMLDTNGLVLAIVLGVVGLLAIGLGMFFEWKSAWCSSLCPVYPVELLYGSEPLITVPNAHCSPCERCVDTCSESTAGVTPRSAQDTRLARTIGIIMTGLFPGFVWGWYQVTTYTGLEGLSNLHLAYGIPYAAGAVTLALYLALRKAIPVHGEILARVFAAAAVITYYWFKLPVFFGIGDPGAAMILDVSAHLPEWSALAMRIFVIVAFSWLLVGRTSKRRSWEVRPPFAADGV